MTNAAAQLATRTRTRGVMEDLQTDTLGRIVTLTQGENAAAGEALASARAFLAATEEKAELVSHIVSWKGRANDIIDAALKAQRPGPEPPKSGTAGQVGREGRRSWRVESAQVEVGDQTLSLASADVEAVVGQVLSQLETRVGDQDEVIIHIVLAQDRE